MENILSVFMTTIIEIVQECVCVFIFFIFSLLFCFLVMVYFGAFYVCLFIV